MAYQVEVTGECSRVAAVTVTAESFRRTYNKALKDLSQRVKLSGFRKGQVPLSVMKRNYGASVMQDVVEKLVNEQVDQLLNEQQGQVLFLAQPRFEGAPSEDAGLSFKVDFELRPELDPVGYMGLEIERPVVEIADEAVDQALAELQEEHATLEPVTDRETIVKGDTVELDFKALGDEPELADMRGEGVAIEVGKGQALPGIEEALEGAASQGVVIAKVTLADNFPVEALRGQEIELELDVKGVKTRVLPALDDELAVDSGKAETLEQLKTVLRDELAAQRLAEANRLAEQSLIKALLAQNSFELPPRFQTQQAQNSVQQQLEQLEQQGINAAQLGINIQALVEDTRVRQADQLKSEFVLMAIAQKEKIKVTPEDMKAYFVAQAPQMRATPAQLEQFIRADQNRMAQAQATVMLDKTVALLLKEASITEIPWPSAAEDEAEAAPAVEVAEVKAVEATEQAE